MYVCVCLYLRVYMQGGNRARLKGPFDVEEEIDYVFCPGCLEDVPEVEAKLFAYRQNMRVSRRCCACVCACGSKHLRVHIFILKHTNVHIQTHVQIYARSYIHTRVLTHSFAGFCVMFRCAKCFLCPICSS